MAKIRRRDVLNDSSSDDSSDNSNDDSSDEFLNNLPLSNEGDVLDRINTIWDNRYITEVDDLGCWDHAGNVLDEIVSVRTVFPDFNRASRVGGLPVRRIHTVHGPSAGGKTAFVLGLAKSFVDVGYLTGYIDAEYTLGIGFANNILKDIKDKPNFLAKRPSSFEDAMRSVDQFLNNAIKVKSKYSNSKSLLIIDSINKLVPKRELSNVLKRGEMSVSGASELSKGHHGRYRASLNQAWLDHLTPRVSESDTAIVFIAQERDNDSAKDFLKKEFKVKGGAALIFDASLVMRVYKSSPVYINPSSDNKGNDNICGFSHKVRIWKSKVAHMDGRYTDCIFNLSNGKLTQSGLDTVRDALNAGVYYDVVKKSGSWFTYENYRSQGFNNMLIKFRDDPFLLGQLLTDINEAMDIDEERNL
jgi:recombination protein RecA